MICHITFTYGCMAMVYVCVRLFHAFMSIALKAINGTNKRINVKYLCVFDQLVVCEKHAPNEIAL